MESRNLPSDPPIRVSCAIIHHEGKILAAQRSLSMNLPLKWEFPGGKLDPGESAAESLHREIMEELGVEIRITAEMPIVLFPSDSPRLELIPFHCEIIRGIPFPREHAALRWLDTQELSELDWSEADLDIIAMLIA
ncbi:MAG: (deoxy)nucleoside triphosphate pyrophosphohydrolase [Bacteroidia bacterium]|nr:(deoxy)nucleoside triphosphate pyrophosphohydrolase [Bacteroidia bacterium]